MSSGNKTTTSVNSSSAKERTSDVDVSDKKRRKATGEVAAKVVAVTAALPPSPVAINKTDDVYATTVRSEEQESQSRATAADADLFHHCSADFRAMLADILQLKLKASSTGCTGIAADKLRAELGDKRADCAHQLVVMKKLNRMDKIRLRCGRDALHKEKLAVDNNHLQLQNLLYEAEHLRKEVQRCFQFKSQDADIELVPEEQFYAEAPAEVARPEQTRSDEHARRLARLEWELQQRKQLAAMCKELQLQKELAAEHITSKTDRLESLAPRLEALLRATRPLQEALAMPVEHVWKVNRVARLLPPPLYMAYANLSAYAEACDVLLVARINGDESDVLDDIEEDDDAGLDASDDVDGDGGAQDDDATTATTTIAHEQEEEMLESDGEEQQQRARHHHHSHHHRDHRRQSQTAVVPSTQAVTTTTTTITNPQRTDEAQLERLFRAHPLSVSFEVRTRSRKPIAVATAAAATLTVTLRYLSALNLITVTCSTAAGAGLATDEPMLSPANMLNSLSPGDTGTDSPNPRTHYQLRAINVEPHRFASLLAGKRLGVAYGWAQQLCGLDMAGVKTAAATAASNSAAGAGDVVTSLEVTQAAVPQVVRKIRQRWQTRLQLCEQVRALSGSIVSPVAATAATASAAELVRWQSIGWPEYRVVPAVQRFVETGDRDGIVTEHDLFYAVTVARGAGRSATTAAARFECAVRVSVQHPRTLPLWALTFQPAGGATVGGVAVTAQTNAIVREIECWINSTTAVDGAEDGDVLAIQLQRARTSLDIYVETTAGFGEGGSGEQREKTFLRAFRSRTRSRPLRAIETTAGSVIYTQV